MNIATCTPVSFEANAHFFSRDTGLLCRGFQQIGHESIVIMPGTPKDDDPSDLVRCSFEQLEDAAWWETMQLDMVVLYAWGDPRYIKIARAIRQCGVILVQNLDTAGILSPYADLYSWWISKLANLALSQTSMQRCREIAKGIRDFFPRAFETKRLKMIADSDYVAAVSPPAADSIAAYAEAFGCTDIVKKIIVLPHPVSTLMRYNGEEKVNTIVVVGRWKHRDEAQKNPEGTIFAIHEFLLQCTNWDVKIIGSGALRLARLTHTWNQQLRDRLHLIEYLPHPDLVKELVAAKVSLCASNFESFHIASAEAVCCGCSIVVPNHPLLASTSWFTTLDSGTLANSHKPEDVAHAMISESVLWRNGNRDAYTIASKWQERLHVQSIAEKLIDSLPI